MQQLKQEWETSPTASAAAEVDRSSSSADRGTKAIREAWDQYAAGLAQKPALRPPEESAPAADNYKRIAKAQPAENARPLRRAWAETTPPVAQTRDPAVARRR